VSQFSIHRSEELKTPIVWSYMSIPKYFLLSGEPHECSIDIHTGKVAHTGVLFLPELA
jgi:hypothetical protein